MTVAPGGDVSEDIHPRSAVEPADDFHNPLTGTKTLLRSAIGL
jgi:hypothetical protein